MTFWDGHDSSGKPVCGAEYRAACKCGASLYSRDNKDMKTSRIKWQAIIKKEDSNNEIHRTN
jgi:hypothetical protein